MNLMVSASICLAVCDGRFPWLAVRFSNTWLHDWLLTRHAQPWARVRIKWKRGQDSNLRPFIYGRLSL